MVPYTQRSSSSRRVVHSFREHNFLYPLEVEVKLCLIHLAPFLCARIDHHDLSSWDLIFIASLSSQRPPPYPLAVVLVLVVSIYNKEVFCV